MKHPFISKTDRKVVELRKDLGDLLKSKYDLARQGSIVFVCGGNALTDARNKFIQIASVKMPEYDFFKPESAIKHPWRNDKGPFNISRFEELIATISVAVVVFPEGPGSFCETGYFAAKEEIAQKTILAIDRKFQELGDSFISTGLLHIINEHSAFSPALYIDYNGNYSEIVDRLRSRKLKQHKKLICVDKYKDLEYLEKMGIIQKIVSIFRIATRDDILFMIRSTFKSQVSSNEINSLIAILLGNEYLLIDDLYGHIYVNKRKLNFIEISTGSATKERDFIFEIVALISNDEVFEQLVDRVLA